MARFRFRGAHDPDENGSTGCQEAASGVLVVGFTTPRLVHPDDVFEVSDVKDRYGNSDADAYRACPPRYEELPDPPGPLRAPAPEPTEEPS